MESTMDAELHHRLRYERKLLVDAKDKYTLQMNRCSGQSSTRLKLSHKRNGGCYYYAKRPGSKQYVYLGSDDHEEVKLIKEAHFIKEALKRIDLDIRLIDSFLRDYREHDHSAIDASLSKAYRQELLPVSPSYRETGEVWLAANLAFQKRFPENFPEHKRHRASDGVMLKTLSELLIYERFKSHELYCIYELPLVLNDYGPPLYPDFTVLSPIDLETVIIVEYVGRMDLSRYREDFARKVGRYMDYGYIPGVNLFFIFGKDDGTVDSTQISKIIADIKGI